MSHVDYDKVLAIVSDESITNAQDFRKLLHKKLQLGQSRYVCRHGTLSEGHDKILDSQRYFQAIKEAWYISSNMLSQKAVAMESYADLLDAEDDLKCKGIRESDRIRAEAKRLKAHQQLLSSLMTVEDQSRQLDEYLKIEKELRDEVDARYPEGIEQAEEDHWKAVAAYRIKNRQLGINETIKNIPLPSEIKANIGVVSGCLDMTTWQITKENLTLVDGLERLADKNGVRLVKDDHNGKNILDTVRKR